MNRETITIRRASHRMARRVRDIVGDIQSHYVNFGSAWREGYYYRLTAAQFDAVRHVKGVRASRIPASEISPCFSWSESR